MKNRETAIVTVAAFVAALGLTACSALQSSGPSKTTKSAQPAAPKAATQPKTSSAPATPPAAAAAPVAKSASGVYAVTFGIGTRASRLGAVQFDARAKSGGAWQGTAGSVSCRNVSGAAMMACNNKGSGVLSCALIDPKGVNAPVDLVTCRFASTKPVSVGDFTIKVTDSSNTDMKPVGVSVVVTRVTGS